MFNAKLVEGVVGASILGASLLLSINADSSMTFVELSKAEQHLTSRTSVVVAIDYNKDVVTTKDAVGFYWKFEGVEDWAIGDGCTMLLYDNDTPNNIQDDTIIKADYFQLDLLEETSSH